MITDCKQALDTIFQSPDNSLPLADNQSPESQDNEKTKPKPHVLRRNIEDYLERKALERKLLDVFDDDYPLD